MADELKLKITLDDGSVKEGFFSLEKQGEKLTDNLTGKFLKIGAVLAAAFSTAKLINYLEDSAKAAIEAERATNALGASLAQIGKFSSEAVNSFAAYAQNLQSTTGFSDDLIKQNAALLVSIGNLSGQGLERGTKAALDLSQALQIDVGSAFDLVAKAASGSTGALGRYGIKIDENIPKAEKWAATLKLIETRFGGLAETRLNTLEGSLIKLNVAFDEIKESIGNIFVNSPALRATINFVADAFLKLSVSITKAIEGKDVLKDLLLVMIQVAAVINNFLIPPAELFVRGFIFGLRTLKLTLDTIVVALVGFTKLLVEALVIPIEGLVKGLGQLVSLVNTGLGESLKNGATSFRTYFTDPLEKEYALVKEIQESTFNAMAADAEDVFSNKMVGSVNDFLLALNDAVSQSSKALTNFKNNTEPEAKAIIDIFKGMRDQINQIFGQGIVSIISGSIQRIGASLVNGGNAFSDFRSFILGLLGDLSIQIGSLLLGIGFGINTLAVSLATFNGAAAIAAGIALIALGGALKALSGGLGSKVPGQSDTGGGVASSPSTSTNLNPTESLERQTPNTSVSVVIQGDVLDSDESGSRIVSLINSAFDKKGVVISQGAFA